MSPFWMMSAAIRIPHRISGDARISFRGSGCARFRLQHTGTRDGEPEALAWCEVSAMSNAALADPRDAIETLDSGVIVGRVFAGHVIGGVLVDVVDGDTDVIYRRHSADFLRITPLDTADGEIDDDNLDACARYEITIEPMA
jgi:hypothetical protein